MDDRAAYSQSQPLYDALRVAASRVEHAQILLQAAMEQVRREHVKTNSNRVSIGEARQESYIDNTVSAWRAITVVFRSIFTELSALTEAKLAEGRYARPIHDQVELLKRTTVDAVAAAYDLRIAGDSTPKSTRFAAAGSFDREQRDSDIESSPRPSKRARRAEESMSAKRGSDTQNSARPSKKARRSAEQPADLTLKKGTKRRPSLDLSDEQAAKVRCFESSTKPDKESHPKRDKASTNDNHRAKSKSSKHDSNSKPPNKSRTMLPDEGSLPAGSYQVEYEDVTAEVEARIAAKAKAAKKESSRREKEARQHSSNHHHNGATDGDVKAEKKAKRKRESLQSTQGEAEPSGRTRSDDSLSVQVSDRSSKRHKASV